MSTPSPVPIPSPPSCFAAPGSYCTPYGQVLLCSQDRYCPGGVSPPLRCPSGKWSAAGAMYLEDCSDHMNVELGVVLALLLMLFALALCCWWSQYAFKVDYENNTRYEEKRQPPGQYYRCYQSCGHYPQPQQDPQHRISIASSQGSTPLPQQPIQMASRYSRVACGPGARV
jgi:hypothetical protein